MDQNIRKAALLLASIPEADSAALMSRLSAEQIEAMSAATSALDTVSTGEQQRLVAELIDHRYHRQPDAKICPSANDKCSAWPSAAQWELEQLQDAPTQWLAEQLSAELPQTAAVVLCHLHPQLAAATLACLSTEKQIQVVKRIADYDAIAPEIIRDIVETLSSRLRLGRLAEINNTGGLALVAQIVLRLDHATERALLENLAQDNRPLVDQLLKLTYLLRDRQRVSSRTSETDDRNDSRAA